MNILPTLLDWQKNQAQKEGIEGYMIVPFKALRAIAEVLPQTEGELLEVKGIGPAKVRRYGDVILGLCRGEGPVTTHMSETTHDSQEFAHASDELDAINSLLSAEPSLEIAEYGEDVVDVNLDYERVGQQVVQEEVVIDENEDVGVGEFLVQLASILRSYFPSVRVRGEVIGFKRNANGHAYFEIKDKKGIMRCSVFRSAYEVSAVDLYDGAEIIITGSPQHHAQYGFSFIGEMVELAGEGALKKAYDDLKKKCAEEGLFAESRKREIPALPERVGLITSATGAAIGDFMTNIGSFGYTIKFASSTVEGSKAVSELLQAISSLRAQEIDALVITRGGGSLESLQAFNNERVVRALAEFPVPVIAGIGHEQDETLVTLVADLGVSTPTAAARAVRASWDQIVSQISHHERIIREKCDLLCTQYKARIGGAQQKVEYLFGGILIEKGHQIDRNTYHIEGGVVKALRQYGDILTSFEDAKNTLSRKIQDISSALSRTQQIITAHDPHCQLARGYSITYDENGQIVRSIGDIFQDQNINIHFSDGSLDAIGRPTSKMNK